MVVVVEGLGATVKGSGRGWEGTTKGVGRG